MRVPSQLMSSSSDLKLHGALRLILQNVSVANNIMMKQIKKCSLRICLVCFFDNAYCIFQNYAVKQWCSTKSLKLTIASVPDVATSFAHWIFNLPIENKTIISETHGSKINLPS